MTDTKQDPLDAMKAALEGVPLEFGKHAVIHEGFAAWEKERATSKRLNRRCQSAESAANEKQGGAGPSFGRSLANYAAERNRRELAALRAAVEKMRDAWDAYIASDCSNDTYRVFVAEMSALDAALRMQDIQKSSDAEAEIICVHPKDKVKIDAALRAKP